MIYSFYLFVLMIFSLRSVALAQETSFWSEPSMLKNASDQQQDQELDNDGFVNTGWQTFWSIDGDDYQLRVAFTEDDLLSKLHVGIEEGQIVLTLERKVLYIALPEEVEPRILKKTINGDILELKFKRKRLRSFI